MSRSVTMQHNSDGRLELLAHGKEAPSLTWKVSESCLDRVVADSQPYIENPAKLDWHWPKSRLGPGA